MEVILLEKVLNLGNLGDQVDVKAGYGRNFLIPQGKAVMATPDNIKVFEERRAELEKAAAEQLDAARARAEKLAELGPVEIQRRAGEDGKLFGSVSTGDIAEVVTAAGVEVEKKEVHLPEGPIRHAGEYEIELQLHSDVTQTVQVNVVPE